MPIFATPAPIEVTLDLSVGETRITASDRADTSVEVRPSDPFRDGDVKAADQTRVEYEDGRLRIRTPKQRGVFSRGGSVDVTIGLPTGSSVRGESALGGVVGRGRFGEFRFKSATGDLRLDRTGPATLRTAVGNIDLARGEGPADVVTGSGELHVEHVDGAAVLRNSNGAIRVGEVIGVLRAQAANGDISVGLAHTDVTATTANGNVRVDEVVRGATVLETAVGRLEVGIRAGTAAWLDVRSVVGAVHNTLQAALGPKTAADTVEIRARTGFGDIVIRRATPMEEDL